jgi:hypothetical protein
MEKTDIGKRIVVIISEHRGETETSTGTITSISDDGIIFEITDKWGNVSRWNETQIKGYKFRSDA